MYCSLDYETRSLCDLPASGAYTYAAHETTKVLCAAYSIDGGAIQLWTAIDGSKPPPDLAAAFANPDCEMHAWNSQFERLITRHVLKLDVPIERWRCTAAWARSRGLPGSLEDALAALRQAHRLTIKREGGDVMKRWAMPINAPTDPAYPKWATDEEDYYKLAAYCRGDVESEMYVQKVLRAVPMSDVEWGDFFINEAINDRGLPIDRVLALSAASYGAAERAELDVELSDLTGGYISTTGQHLRVKRLLAELMPAWVFEQYFVSTEEGKTKVSTDKRAREEFLQTQHMALDQDGAPPISDQDREAVDHTMDIAKQILEILDDASKSSVSKFAKMAAYSDTPGHLAKGAYLYAGAGQTKRYSSRGIQMHNLPRAVPPAGALEAVLSHTLDTGGGTKVMHVLASLLRPTIKAPRGRKLIWGDWSSVEARAMPWLAGAESKLDMYRNGVDVYRVNAKVIFGTDYDNVPDDERQIGKVAELSLQFGGSVGALRAMARAYGIALDLGLAHRIVHLWRADNKWAPDFSYGLFRAFSTCAMRASGATYRHGRVTYKPLTRYGLGDKLTIECQLPDGTRLFYPGLSGGDRWEDGFVTDDDGVSHPIYKWINMPKRLEVVLPAVVPEVTRSYLPRGRMELTYSKALASGTAQARVWHGLLAENATQGLCAALLRDCLERVDIGLYEADLDAAVIGHTHDEIIIEASTRDSKAAADLLHREMVSVPEWLPGFPLAAEITIAQRYGKK